MKHVVRTACTRDCPDACQILATVEDGRITQLQGDPAHPVTRGFLCYRTDHYLERQYSDERLTTPLIRRAGRLDPAGWDEALDLCAARLKEALREWGAPSILHYSSGGSLGMMKLANRRFFDALGPVSVKRGDICSGAGDAAQHADMGFEDAHDLDDLKNSRTIFLWGKNAAESGSHLIPHLVEARRRGARVIQIDPVWNARTNRHVDRYVQIRPGGDGFLALGMARVIIDSGWHDPQAPEYCSGWDEFAALVRGRPVEEWAARADVTAALLTELAGIYTKEGPTAAFVGWGLGRRIHGSKSVRTLDALGAITGNLGRAGGGVSFYFQRRSGFDTSFMNAHPGRRTLLEPLLGEEILRADPPVKVAVFDTGNPASQLPDSATVARALRSIPFLVVIDAFLTDTAELASVVLPTTTMLEEHDVVGAYGHHWVQLAQPVVPPPDGVRSDLEIYRGIAERLGVAAALNGDAQSWIDRMLAPMRSAGVTREALAEGARRKPEAPRVLFADRRFTTESGRFTLIREFPQAPPEPDPGWPLRLMSISSYKWQSSQVLIKDQQEPPEVTMHPDAAGGRAEGSLARLVSPIGAVPVRLRFDARQRRDLVIYPKGRWGKFGGPNSLTRARLTDAGEGAAYYDEGVRLE